MVQFHDSIPDNLAEWISNQHMFFVASAPLTGDGHVNVSPKGLKGTLHIVNPNKVWYEDLTGSGIETTSHIREPGNGRLVIMFCAFEGGPRIMRLWGKGSVHEFGTPEYEAFLPPEKRLPGSRSAIVLDVQKVSTSCGFAVPQYNFIQHRPTLLNWTSTLVEKDITRASECPDDPIANNGLKAYWEKTNRKSLDGLPGIQSAPTTHVVPIHAPSNGEWGKESKKTSTVGRLTEEGATTAIKGQDRHDVEMFKLLLAFASGLAVATLCMKLSIVV